ncbi:phosphoribosylaminoimidazole-succinocarboxamide synthase [Scopulibacillus darangshiensis]|uniref:Phosphoribosylaminoimidazole-succinocarboxamide synthase n=1 Tax=Scopulibacillus darangshiensis TaxID=442528 RepID=A0A4R2NQF8_9BACL|nr:phosphoribosylaminoimidazolesuccinocarboxamide synthase [Scopulibacillus darangshiensis]TCP24099.1 phosphoribosylaminoimidazole-succinocarboxamide synthase [Scopulibacillus darangshiensis]
MQLLYEGKAKKIFLTDDPDILHVQYKDHATAFNGEKFAVLPGKGRLNNLISSKIFEVLSEKNVTNHFVKSLSETEQLVKAVDIIPIEVVVRNVTAGSLAKRLGLEEGETLKSPIIEFYYKNDELGDPLINDDHIAMMELATSRQLNAIRLAAQEVNTILTRVFDDIGIMLVDFKLEFGTLKSNGELVLADEVSPDTCRLWDKETREKFDKDVFRRDLGDLPEVYEKLLRRLEGVK